MDVDVFAQEIVRWGRAFRWGRPREESVWKRGARGRTPPPVKVALFQIIVAAIIAPNLSVSVLFGKLCPGKPPPYALRFYLPPNLARERVKVRISPTTYDDLDSCTKHITLSSPEVDVLGIR